jgi:hypothetical protein
MDRILKNKEIHKGEDWVIASYMIIKTKLNPKIGKSCIIKTTSSTRVDDVVKGVFKGGFLYGKYRWEIDTNRTENGGKEYVTAVTKKCNVSFEKNTCQYLKHTLKLKSKLAFNVKEKRFYLVWGKPGEKEILAVLLPLKI